MENLGALVLSTAIVLEGPVLRVRYRLENRSTVPLDAVNRLTRYVDGQGWVPDPAVVYVFLSPSHVQVAKRIPPPPDRFVAALRDYYVTRVAPGEAVSEELEVPVPVRPALPYEFGIPRDAPARAGRVKVEFVLGVLPPRPFALGERQGSGGESAFPLREPVAPAEGHLPPATARELLLRSEEVELELAIQPHAAP